MRKTFIALLMTASFTQTASADDVDCQRKVEPILSTLEKIATGVIASNNVAQDKAQKKIASIKEFIEIKQYCRAYLTATSEAR